MKLLSFFVVFTFVLENTYGKVFYCHDDIFFSTCAISGVTSDDKFIEIKFKEKSFGYRYENSIESLTFENSTIENFPKITTTKSNILTLNCIGCGLRNLSAQSFDGLVNLTRLDISYHALKKLPDNLFGQMSKLENLNVSYGSIEIIEKNAFANLTKVEKLDLSYNNIKLLTEETFTPLISLEKVYLNHNKIKELNGRIFYNNIKLSYIYLGNNKMKTFNGEIFNPNNDLKLLEIGSNELISLDTFNIKLLDYYYYKTRSLDASNNKISQLSIGNNIYGLKVQHNNIQRVVCESGRSLLGYLNLSNNALNELGCISSLSNLRTLDLRFNNISHLDHDYFAYLNNLNALYLRSNKIKNLPLGIFSHQIELTTLDISYNQLGNIQFDVFVSLTTLSSLYIDGNNITEFPYKILKSMFKGFRTIGIGNNNFNCSFLIEAIKYLNEQKIKAIVSSGEKVIQSHNINGIGCTETTPNITETLTKQETSFSTETFVQNTKDCVVIQHNVPSSDKFIKTMNIILITIIIVFCVYKGYQWTKKDHPRYSLHQPSLEMNDYGRNGRI